MDQQQRLINFNTNKQKQNTMSKVNELLERAKKYNKSANSCGERLNQSMYQYWVGKKQMMETIVEMLVDPTHTHELIMAKLNGSLPMQENAVETCREHNNELSMQYWLGMVDGSNECIEILK